MNKHITKIGKTALVVTLMTTILTQGSSFINNVNAQTSQIADEFTSLSLLSSGDFEKKIIKIISYQKMEIVLEDCVKG